ncbi:citramalate synthase [Neobittarella massiliensis]|uniref:Citramalate synthase n=1 Tax=Neobittarella massiliensis (ex Bilen et al. 2018) TaxID=2041842 RepID=A0A8J6INT7_9FIRM|nr:citramalate synthase [Neobittarella massiliensis]MBC3515138.1 citramalate synthase [Neobittarella massiliensis]
MQANPQSQRVWLCDSSLRDGSQGKQIAFSVADKIDIIRALDEQGIPFIEAGNPSAGPKDVQLFERMRSIPLQNSRLVAFGATRRKNCRPQDDVGLQALLAAGTEYVTVFGKSWDMQVDQVLRTTLEENLAMISDTVANLVAQGRQVLYDAEHFFDGYRHNPTYAMQTVRAARQAGATCVILCDTNGAALPAEVGAVTAQVVRQLGGEVGIHCHDDIGCAVAASLAAVEAGARHVQGTFVGYGERCGNANLSTILPVLQLKMGYSCVAPQQLPLLTGTARHIADISNVILRSSLPFVGSGAFSHKAGMHVDAVHKNSQTFEHIDPGQVGNERHILISEVGGKAALLHSVKKIQPDIKKDDPVIEQIRETIKKKEMEGYQYESAEASLKLLILGHLKRLKPHFKLDMYRIMGEQNSNIFSLSTAIVKVTVGDGWEMTADEGKGPVNALDKATRKAVTKFYPAIQKVRLIDYKVRVVDQNTASAARVRVLIETSDGEETWTTVGTSRDIIKASLRAIVDSLEYKLSRDDGSL